MKKILYFLMVPGVLAIMAGCKHYLDIKPKGSFIPQKTKDYRLLLDETSPRGKSNGFFETFSMDLMLDNDMSINPFSQTYYTPADLNAFRYAEHIYLDYESDLDWESMYNQVYTANLVISQVMDATDGTKAEKARLMAEARVQRAFAYFILVNLYGKQYDPATAAEDPGVPIRKELDFEEKLPRASVREVYDYIVQDLKQAVPHLPLKPDMSAMNRPVRPTAYTLLARAYLFMDDPAKAYQYADSSLQCYHRLVDYNTLPPNQAYPDDVLSYPTNFHNPETLMEKTANQITPLVYASDALLDLYDREHDLRFKAFFFPDKLFGLNFGFFSNEWSGRNPSKGPSVPETYLLRAECSARLGHTADAMADVNLLRSYRYKTGSPYKLTASNPAEALQLVKEERRRELAFRGYRYFDIKRYNVMDHAGIAVTHVLGDSTYTLAPNSNRAVLPIARKYIALNPEITQNPR